MKKLWLLLLVGACHKAYYSDETVLRKEIGTETACQPVIGGSGGCVTTEYTTFYLVSTNKKACEVSSHEYLKAEPGKLVLCEWETMK